MLLSATLAVIAMLFACVGQAGGAGYVAVMGLFGYGPSAIKATALVLTSIVAAIGILRYQRAGLIRTRDWYPFALLGVPLSLAGGMITLPGTAYRLLAGVLLVLAAVQMLRSLRAAARHDDAAAAEIPFLPAVVAGGVTGLTAGLTGMGAGVFMAAVIFSLKWAPTRRAAAITQVSNIFTALPALAGVLLTHPVLPPALPLWALAAGIGGLLGAWAGSKHLPVTALRLILAVILLASGIRLALG